jgi:hypothetical protein
MPTSKRRIAVATALAATIAVSALIVAVAPSRATFRGPNGLIVFSQQAGEHRQLFTIRPDGRALTQITRLRGGREQSRLVTGRREDHPRRRSR